VFKTDRILLRAEKREDIPRRHEFDQDPELAGLDSGYPVPSTFEQLEARFEASARDKPDDNAAWFAIEADGKYIGDCCLIGLKDRNGNVELGIRIGDRAYWNRGYGREAVGLLLEYAFHYLGMRRVVLTTHSKNLRAIRCYQACGFVEEGRPRQVLWIEGEWTDLVNMSILRDEWLIKKQGSC
jgi:RimJ/RimL family protein N-acetyltransferase